MLAYTLEVLKEYSQRELSPGLFIQRTQYGWVLSNDEGDNEFYPYYPTEKEIDIFSLKVVPQY